MARLLIIDDDVTLRQALTKHLEHAGHEVRQAADGDAGIRAYGGHAAVVATSIWVWLAVVDAAVGQPFRTFTVLGGLDLFTILHYLFNVVYGIVIVSLVHGAGREPSLVIGMAFGFLVIEFGFVIVTVLLSHLGLGELAWARILGGNLIGAALPLVVLSPRHRLRDEFRQAEEEENE